MKQVSASQASIGGRGLRILEDASRDAPLLIRPSRLVRRLLEVVRLERVAIMD